MRLVFVYNAEGGLLHGLLDSIHKVVSPRTYECDLCAITYGLTSMKAEWRDWLGALEMPSMFLHRAEFRATWPTAKDALPAIFAEREGRLHNLVSAGDFESVQDVSALIALLEGRMAKERA